MPGLILLLLNGIFVQERFWHVTVSYTHLSGAVYQLEEFHHWAKNPFQNEGKTFDDAAWKDWYARIAIANVVIPKVDDMLDDPEEERNRIKGEALFLRAGFYFLLTNFYGLPYREASAATDLSVPLKLTEYIDCLLYTSIRSWFGCFLLCNPSSSGMC